MVDSVARMFGLNWEIPHHTTCHAWLQRIGRFQLQRPKDMADDSIWILDHTVQIGQEKCLVIPGLRVRDMPATGTALSMADLQLRNLLPVKIRCMNLASLLRWGRAILSVLDRQPETVLRHGTAERFSVGTTSMNMQHIFGTCVTPHFISRRTVLYLV